MVTKIGENAGRIWTLLSGNGAMSPSKIKTSLKLTDLDLNLSIGWLAREDKINIAESKNSFNISLK